MSESETIRASALPRILACPPSRHPPAVEIRGDDEDAELGTLVHAWIADSIDNGSPLEFPPDDEAARLCKLAWRAWEQLATHFHAGATEEFWEAEGDGFILTGHPDVAGESATTIGQVNVIDWKTGRLEADWLDQLKAYAWLALLRSPDAETVYAAVVKVRTGEIIPNVWSRAELAEWFDGIPEKLRDRAFHPGPHCTYCPRAHECPGRLAHLRDAVGVLVNGYIPATPTDENLAAAVVNARMIARVCEQIIAYAKTEASRRPVAGLEVVEREVRRIDPVAAFPILSRELGPAVSQVVTIGLEKLQKAAMALAPRGKKSEAAKRLLDMLDQAGAIYRDMQTRLETRPVPEKVPVLQQISSDLAAVEQVNGDPLAAIAPVKSMRQEMREEMDAIEAAMEERT
jgi:hypothetical protein